MQMSRNCFRFTGGQQGLTARVCACLLLVAQAGVLANQPPNAPIIFEPVFEGIELNAADVHMVSGFTDPDGGDTHMASDYEIWNNTMTERVWAALNITGLAKIHLHFGDGAFMGSHSGRTTLHFETSYKFRVRHQDNNGAWGPFATRGFVTGPQSQIFPMILQDVAGSPAPTWKNAATNANMILPTGGTQPSLRVESNDGAELLLEFKGLNGSSNAVTNPGPITGDRAMRVTFSAGSLAAGLVLPESNLAFTDNQGENRTAYLPPVSLATGQSTFFWVSINGSTYQGAPGQTDPDFSNLVRGSPVPWTSFDSNFKVEVVATGFRLPTHIAFVPNPGPNPLDPFYYVTELHDGVKVVTRNGTVMQYATNILNFTASGSFSGPGEIGVSGIAVDPFNGNLFVGLMYSIGGNTGGPWTARIVKMTSTDGGLTMSSMQTIVDDAPNQYSYSHIVGQLTIGPDNKLYAAIGEGNVAAPAQNLDDFRGKILRINLDGTAPTDNPFYTTPSAKRSFVWSYGYRNPFGSGWRSASGKNRLYVVENGPSTDRLSKSGHGHNNNWGTAGDSDGQMFSNAIHNWSPAHAPTALAFIQQTTFGGSGFPASKMGRLYVAESGPTAGIGPWAQGKRIVEFQLHADPDVHFTQSKLSGPNTLVEYTGSGAATACGLAAGPDGLYFTDLYKDFGGLTQPGANVLRIRYKGTGTIAGHVKDDGNNPLQNATVTINPGGQFTTTDAGGNYSLFNVSTGTYSVTAQKAGFSTSTLPSVQVVENQTFMANFTLQVGVTNGTISGFVKDGNGVGLVGAVVQTTTGGFSTTAGAGGSYLLDGVTPGTYNVEASFNGFVGSTKSSINVAAGQNSVVNFTLEPIAPFDGVANGGFEGGFFNDPNLDHQTGNSWKQFTLSGFSKSGGHAGIKHGGTWSQSFWESNYISGLWQKVANASVGSQYTGKVWVRGFVITFHVGLVPTGATDPLAGTVQWSSPATPGDNWVQISTQVTAQTTNVTLFIKAQNPSALNRNSFIDDATIDELFIPPVSPTISRSPSSFTPSIQTGENASSDQFTVSNTGDGTLNYAIGDNVTWLSVSPTTGASTGEADTITINYTTAALGAGTHPATITISDPTATNNPQTIAVTLTVSDGPPTAPGDFDGDGDVDLSDFGHMQTCLTGPGVIQSNPNCADAKLDNDVDVDQDDIGIFQACMSGANIPASLNCNP